MRKVPNNSIKARSQDPFMRTRLLLVPKIGSCKHIENYLPLHGSVILKKRMEIGYAYFHLTLVLKDERRRQILYDIAVFVLASN